MGHGSNGSWVTPLDPLPALVPAVSRGGFRYLRKGGHNFPSPSPPLSFPSIPSPSPLPSPLFKNRPPLIQLGSLGERCKLPQRDPGPQEQFWHIWSWSPGKKSDGKDLGFSCALNFLQKLALMAACLQGTACKFDLFALHDAGDIHG